MKLHRLSKALITLSGAAIILLSARADIAGQTDPPKAGADQVQPMSRGPIHEGFAQPTVFDPKPGMIAPKEPPKPVEEIPPEQKPEGDNVAWIPGYWSWDAEAQNFLWVSGTWRVMPPGRQWIPGYWKKVDAGHQWVSGFWGAAGKTGVEYLPTPPPSLEIGPSSDAPGKDYIWSPGCWRWHDSRYVWQAGCWIGVHPDWIWCPPCYNWTPGGCIYTDGYWDYALHRRGLLFAPVCFNEPLYLNAGYHYSPSVCVDLGLITDHFFCWPSYRHYCFGNFYSDFHLGCGISPWFSFYGHRHHRWCDPIFSHSRWDHCRRDPHWHDGICRKYDDCRLNDHARPDIHHKNDGLLANAGKPDNGRLTKPVEHIAAKRDLPLKLDKLGADARRELGGKTADLQRLREQRGYTESQASREGAAKPNAGAGRPSKLDLPASPIAAKPGSDLPTPRPGPKLTDAAKPASIPQRGGTGPVDLAKPRQDSPRFGNAPGNNPTGPLPRGGESAPLQGSRIEPRRDLQPGKFEAPRIDTRPKLESRPDLNLRPPSSAPKFESRSRFDSAPRFESSPRFSPAPRGGEAPRFSSPPSSSSGPAMRGGSSGGSIPRSSAGPSRSFGGGGDARIGSGGGGGGRIGGGGGPKMGGGSRGRK